MSLDEALADERGTICQNLIGIVINKLKGGSSTIIQKRLVSILKQIITESETKGIDV